MFMYILIGFSVIEQSKTHGSNIRSQLLCVVW